MATDAYGNTITNAQTQYVKSVGINSLPQYAPNPAFGISNTYSYNTTYTALGQAALSTAPSPTPVQFQVTFDTIGQIIPYTLGACLLPFKTLWIQGVTAVSDQLTINTFAPAGSVDFEVHSRSGTAPP